MLTHGCSHHTPRQQVPLQEKLALIDLKTAMQPPGRAVYMNDWLVDTDPCENEWQGIVCDCVEVGHDHSILASHT